MRRIQRLIVLAALSAAGGVGIGFLWVLLAGPKPWQAPAVDAALVADATATPGESFAGKLPPLTDAERASSGRLRAHVEALAGRIGERNVFQPEALEAAAVYLEAELTALGFTVGRQPYDCNGKQVRNLDATLAGKAIGGNAEAVATRTTATRTATATTQPAEAGPEWVVVGAHYDSVRGSPGANDNGSGVAALLEVARLLKAAGPPAGRSVRFVLFVNEEPPFFHGPQMGSVVYAKRCKDRGERVAAMLSLETMGCYSDVPGSQAYPPPMGRGLPVAGDFVAFVGDTSAKDLVRRCVGSFRSHTRFPSQGVSAPDQVQGISWSDHWYFARQGFPALMVTDTAKFRYSSYHTARDTPDKVDYDRLARVTAGVARVVSELAEAK